MASIFWDVLGILIIDYLEKEKTITGECYITLLDELNEEYKSIKAIVKLDSLGYELLPPAPHSADLALSD